MLRFALDRDGRRLFLAVSAAAILVWGYLLVDLVRGTLGLWSLGLGLGGAVLSAVVLLCPTLIFLHGGGRLELRSALRGQILPVEQLESLTRLDRSFALLSHSGGRLLLTTRIQSWPELLDELCRQNPRFSHPYPRRPG